MSVIIIMWIYWFFLVMVGKYKYDYHLLPYNVTYLSQVGVRFIVLYKMIIFHYIFWYLISLKEVFQKKLRKY